MHPLFVRTLALGSTRSGANPRICPIEVGSIGPEPYTMRLTEQQDVILTIGAEKPEIKRKWKADLLSSYFLMELVPVFPRTSRCVPSQLTSVSCTRRPLAPSFAHSSLFPIVPCPQSSQLSSTPLSPTVPRSFGSDQGAPRLPSSCQEVCKRHQAAFSSDTSLTGTPFTYLAPW